MDAPSTVPPSPRTLYRLIGVDPSADGMFDCVSPAQLDEIGAEFLELDDFGVPAVAFHGLFAKEEASWCADFSRLTNWPVRHPSWRGAALLLLAIDREVYALCYGEGYRLVPHHLKDRRFGLRFVVRSVDPTDIRAAVARTPGQGRTDIAVLPGGAPVGALGLDTYTKLVQSMGGRLASRELTVERAGGDRAYCAEGGAGLRLPYGADAASLVRDIRTIARVCREEPPRPELEFVESVAPIKEAATVRLLDERLDQALGTLDGARLGATVPEERLPDFALARAIGVRFRGSEEHRGELFDLEYVRGRLRFHRTGRRVTALRECEVTLYRDARARKDDVIGRTRLVRWVEAELLGADGRRFVLTDGVWHEFDAAYHAGLGATVSRLMPSRPSLELPVWPDGVEERAYNEGVADGDPGFVCLDRRLVTTPLHRPKGVEICDLLGPDDTLVMVKQADGSSELSHLFSQGVVAVEALLHQPEARRGFAERVAALGKGRRLPEDFRPRRVVFAIRLKRHARLTPATLFPFARVALVQAARTLESYGISVEVVGIPSEAEPGVDAGTRAA
ncbi:TIGR04141 family sporadically distributed protein [Streptomyces millisiae]|uniref:TIGR04141 family sporadically distributed protein n=1 Tax=Streptomyces millisiae TaxID=3075542 RepID=A0ABU2LLI2_9ACTN|nr:DUF6119 family protein [Streptomyces sp. DSM 44918]MDT0318444.1 TIGR04141 family sporadically distributed protein [Streptomyces sp. DSM 44918]